MQRPARRGIFPGTMTAATWITMIAILAFVWGGFLVALSTAVRKESEKTVN